MCMCIYKDGYRSIGNQHLLKDLRERHRAEEKKEPTDPQPDNQLRRRERPSEPKKGSVLFETPHDPQRKRQTPSLGSPAPPMHQKPQQPSPLLLPALHSSITPGCQAASSTPPLPRISPAAETAFTNGRSTNIFIGTLSDMHAKLINMGRHASCHPATNTHPRACTHTRTHAQGNPCLGGTFKRLCH